MYVPVQRSGPAIRAALATAAPHELPEFEAELRIALAEADEDLDLARVDHILNRWWGLAHLRLNPPTPEEKSVIAQVARGDFHNLAPAPMARSVPPGAEQSLREALHDYANHTVPALNLDDYAEQVYRTNTAASSAHTLLIRELADAALAGHRHWTYAADLAAHTGLPADLTGRVLAELEHIGVIRKSLSDNSFDVTNLEKAVTLVASIRNVHAETVRSVSLATAERLWAGPTPTAIGGMDAAIHHLGTHTVAATGPRSPKILYLAADAIAHINDDGTDPCVAVLALDQCAARTWTTGYTSWTQTYGDLFGLPGRQAEEVRRTMFTSILS
jgi:hypothetical protein